MIVRTLEKCEQTDRRVVTKNWESTRLLLKGDKMGYSVHVTTIYEGAELEMEYRNHLEAVYLTEGEGEIVDLKSGKTYSLAPGTIYALDQHDRHILRAIKQLRMVCVFNPPVIGNEVHDETGAYPLEADEVGSSED